MRKIKIENRVISENSPCFIIAEAGINHNGDIESAKKDDINNFSYIKVINGHEWNFNYTKKDILKIILSIDEEDKQKMCKKFVEIDFINVNINKFLNYFITEFCNRQISSEIKKIIGYCSKE